VLRIDQAQTVRASQGMARWSPFLKYFRVRALTKKCINNHIINVIVNSGLKRLKLFLDDFRTEISVLSSSNQRIATYKQFCIASMVHPQKFGLDMDVRWNSTYLMLYHLVP
jgi:hypothetical protein